MSVWGIVPAAGMGSRIQPLAFSKELLPVGSRRDGDTERPRAVSEYLIERMILGGAEKICLAISPGKSDILGYYGGHLGEVSLCYVIQQHPRGLCDAIFHAAPVIAPGSGRGATSTSAPWSMPGWSAAARPRASARESRTSTWARSMDIVRRSSSWAPAPARPSRL